MTLLHLLLSGAYLCFTIAAQSCYYPNGNPATGDIPCSQNDGGSCCPQGWTCLDSGLCYLENQNYLGRYTCTDKNWSSPGCPNYCTQGGFTKSYSTSRYSCVQTRQLWGPRPYYNVRQEASAAIRTDQT